jgi:Na+/proline symporter
MALYSIKSLWDLFMALVGLLGGGLAGVFVLGIFTRRANAVGAVAGVVCSTAVLYCVQHFTEVHFFLYGAVGILTCVCTGYLMSLMIPTSKLCSVDLTIYGLKPLAS